MRRKAKKHEPVDDLIDALVKMRRKAKKKRSARKLTNKPKIKRKLPSRVARSAAKVRSGRVVKK
jgi:hypothetical protein